MAKKNRKGKSKGNPIDELIVSFLALVAVVAGTGSAAARWMRERRGGAQQSPPAAQAPESKYHDARDWEKPGGIKGKLYDLGEKFKPLEVALRVQDRYGELHGNNLAAAVTFQSFVSLFPLLLVIVAVIGFFSASSGTDVAGRIIGELGLSGDASQAVGDAVTVAEKSRRSASLVGLAGLLWSGLGLVNALQFAYNQVWQVQERGVIDKAYGLLWLVGAALVFVATAAVTTVLNFLPGFVAPLGIVVALGANFALWMWTSGVLPNNRIGWRDRVPGSVLGAVGLEALKLIGAFYVPRLVASSSALYGSLGVVFAILAWLFFFGRLIVYSATLNVVLYERKAGTIVTTIEVPRQPGADAQDDVNRAGRLEKGALKEAS